MHVILQYWLLDFLIKMSYNSNSLSWHSKTKYNNERYLTTKITSNSYDFKSQLVLVMEKIINLLTSRMKSQSFKQIKKSQQIKNGMMSFINHCATLIQSQFRGYIQRKYYKMFKPVLHRFKQLLLSVALGWKIRKIMKLKGIQKKIEQIKNKIITNNFRQARIKKRQFIDQIVRLQKKGKWVQIFNSDRKYYQQHKKTNIITIFRSKNSKQKQTSIPQKKINKSKQQIEKLKTKKREIAIQKAKKNYQQQQINTDFVPSTIQRDIPIKSTGHYNIPELNQPLKQDIRQKKVKEKPSKQIIKRKKQGEKNIKKEQKDKQKNKDQIQSSNQQQIIREQFKQIDKKIEQNKNASQMSIHLPVQQIQLNQNVAIPNKTMKFERISRLLQDPKVHLEDSKLSTQKLKKSERKGIKVTLSSNVAIAGQENKKRTTQIQSTNPQRKDELIQILQVYNGVYLSKRLEIAEKINELKTHRKFNI